MKELRIKSITEMGLDSFGHTLAHAGNKQFCVRRAEVQNSTVALRLNFSNKLGRSASISRPNAKLPAVVCNH